MRKPNFKFDLRKEISLPRPSLRRRGGSGGAAYGRASRYRGPRLSMRGPSSMPRPSMPLWMSRLSIPQLTRSRSTGAISSRRSSLPTPDVKVPKFLADLYADLRDRRLLPLVAVLLVAIVAAPIILGDNGGEEESTAPPITGTAQASTSDASFSVVPAEPGLRDYRRRLSHREARDPFNQPSSGGSGGSNAKSGSESTTATQQGGESPGGEITVEGGAGASPSETEVTPPPVETSPVETSPAPVETSPAPVETKSSPPVKPTETTRSVVVEKELTGFEIDIHAGFLGHQADQTKIPAMTKLPSPKQPVLVYLGASKDQKGALFLLSSEVTAFYGKGHCTLDKRSCSVLELRPGKSATFVYGLEGDRYKLTLGSIVPILTTHEASSTVTDGHGR